MKGYCDLLDSANYDDTEVEATLKLILNTVNYDEDLNPTDIIIEKEFEFTATIGTVCGVINNEEEDLIEEFEYKYDVKAIVDDMLQDVNNEKGDYDIEYEILSCRKK